MPAVTRQVHNVVMPSAHLLELVHDLYALGDASLMPPRKIPQFEAFIPSDLFEVTSGREAIIGSIRSEARRILVAFHAAPMARPETRL